jgi:hypothetical protein
LKPQFNLNRSFNSGVYADDILLAFITGCSCLL